MKKVKRTVAFLIAAIMVLSMSTIARSIVILDEDGNIIENEALLGGIIPLMGDLDNGFYEIEESFLPSFGSATGEVVELRYNDYDGTDFISIRITLDGEYEGEYTHANFIVDDNTFIIGDAPKVGDTVTGFFDNLIPIIMIYPPQYKAVVLVNRDYDLPRIIVERFDEDWVSSGRQFRLNIGEDTEIVFQNGEAFEGEIEKLIGRKLVVEFTISHFDIPETIPNPQKITVLYERIATGAADLWQDILWWSEDFDPANYEIIITINGLSRGVPNANFVIITNGTIRDILDTLADMGDALIYVPLRVITEMLGFTPEWNAATREVLLNSPRGEITFRIWEASYIVESSSGIVNIYDIPPAVIIDSRTYVPLSFFRKVFGFNNAWWEGGHIHLDNSEQMN